MKAPEDPKIIILDNFWAQARKWPQKTEQLRFYTILRPKPENELRRPEYDDFGRVSGPGGKMAPEDQTNDDFGLFFGPSPNLAPKDPKITILDHLGAQAGKWSQKTQKL